MEFLLKLLSVLMVILLITVQFMFLLPCGADFGTDGLNGEPIKSYQSIIGQGYATMNLLGEYAANSASLYINGRHIMVIQRFPVKLKLTDGDVVEIHAAKDAPDFHIYFSEKSSGIYTDIKNNPVRISPGMNRVMRVNIRDCP
ncbi:MAG: hypothetical protein GX027_05305 [Clostridiaceae bacterium]|jgi:hypothetical protein|nr:hypothetical protein [Clostridiaceae bacterium]